MKFLKKLFNINGYVVLLYTAIIIVLMIYVFVIGSSNEILDYVAYLVSAYCFSAICIWFGKKGKSKIDYIFENNKYLKRFKEDPIVKTLFSLYKGLTLNGIYALFKLISGIIYKSIWFITFGIYYLFLGGIRTNLVVYARNNELGENIEEETKKYRASGILLLFLNLVLSGMIVLIIVKNQKIIYPGFMIYVMAIYTFYVVISSIINIVKAKKYKSPVISAVGAINFSQALISMLSLEVAMLNQFSSDNSYFNNVMIGITGFSVSGIFTIMSIYMIIKSYKRKTS